jgi:hypothetical protein
MSQKSLCAGFSGRAWGLANYGNKRNEKSHVRSTGCFGALPATSDQPSDLGRRRRLKREPTLGCTAMTRNGCSRSTAPRVTRPCAARQLPENRAATRRDRLYSQETAANDVGTSRRQTLPVSSVFGEPAPARPTARPPRQTLIIHFNETNQQSLSQRIKSAAPLDRNKTLLPTRRMLCGLVAVIPILDVSVVDPLQGLAALHDDVQVENARVFVVQPAIARKPMCAEIQIEFFKAFRS